jgi:hypothetical protein
MTSVSSVSGSDGFLSLSDCKIIVKRVLEDLISKGSGADADSDSHCLALLAMEAQKMCPQKLFELSMLIWESDDRQLAKAFFILLTDTCPKKFGVAHFFLAKLHRVDLEYDLAVHQYLLADCTGCALALEEMEEVRNLPEYHPSPVDLVVEKECIENARTNMSRGRFLDADRFLHKAILAGSKEALEILNHMRQEMFEKNIYYGEEGDD